MDHSTQPSELLSLPLGLLERQELRNDGSCTGADLGLDYRETPASAEFQVAWQAYSIGREKIVQGHVAGTLKLECARCAIPFDRRFRVDFRHCYVPGAAKDVFDTPDDGDFYFDETAPSLDLRKGLREEILLVLPIKPIPEPGEPGHCKTCDLEEFKANVTPGEPEKASPFSGLARLLEESQPATTPEKPQR